MESQTVADDRTDTHPAAPVHYEHYCEHEGCNRWGSLGFSRSRSEPVHWWCAEHYPHKDMHRT